MPHKKTSQAGQTIALTGATGFVGTHMMRLLVGAGHTVRALTRRPQEAVEGVTWVAGDLENSQSLSELCQGADCVIHAGGLTKALNRNEFFDVNVGGTKKMLIAAKEAGVRQFLFVSSIAAREAQLSHYAASKAAAELALASGNWPFKWTTVRPPAIYGPGDMEILKIFKATRLGVLPAIGSNRNRFSMIHVGDLCQAMLQIMEGSFHGETLEIDDEHPSGYRMQDVIAALPDAVKKPTLITVPYPLVALIGHVNGLFAAAVRRPAILTAAKAKELCHKDWVVRAGRRPSLKDYTPAYQLTDGLKETLEWYKTEGYL